MAFGAGRTFEFRDLWFFDVFCWVSLSLLFTSIYKSFFSL